ncbi:MAG: glycosyltransferase family 4 protein [Oscillospiraceae bacterium]|nr:glycosyltransferase family 4 protein [Oscillospiraceae bacterium]
MKILILTNFDVGLYQFRRELVGELLKEHQVFLSLPDGELVRPLEQMGCVFLDTPMERRGLNPVKDLGLMKRYWQILRRERPDLVIGYTIKPNIYGGLVCRMLGIPMAANITGLGTAFQKEGLLKKLVVTLYKPALKKAKVVFFENQANMDALLEEKIVRREQCCLLSGAGVNLEHYAYTPYPEGKEVRFLFVGRVMQEKGIEELFDAMERLRGEGYDCALDVLGGFEEHYEDAIRRHEQAGWLRYHGYVTDVRPYIEQAHCFVLPSYHEGMANTNLECAAMGRPLITSDIPGCREAVIDGKSGILCRAQNADSLYEAMKRFLHLSREEREQMGKAGRAHMEAVFDKKIVVGKTVEALGLKRN